MKFLSYLLLEHNIINREYIDRHIRETVRTYQVWNLLIFDYYV